MKLISHVRRSIEGLADPNPLNAPLNWDDLSAALYRPLQREALAKGRANCWEIVVSHDDARKLGQRDIAARALDIIERFSLGEPRLGPGYADGLLVVAMPREDVQKGCVKVHPRALAGDALRDYRARARAVGYGIAPAGTAAIELACDWGGAFRCTGTAVIGRDENADLTCPFPHVSRKHACLLYERGRWFIEDMGSTNGTLLNGRPVSGAPRPLNSGDSIVLAEEAFLTVRRI